MNRQASKGGAALFSYEMIKSLNNLEILIYNYVVCNPQKVIDMTIRELSNELHVSTTTVLRFCHKAGCEGYSEFKYSLKEYVKNNRTNDVIEDFTILQDFFKKAESREFNNQLQTAAEIICSKRNIYFIGMGTSGTLGKYGARYISNLGLKAFYIDDPFYPTEGGDYTDSAVIALSVSGEQKILHKQIVGLKNGNAAIISITNTRQCTLASISDFNIAYYMPMKVLPGLYNVTSQVPVMYILESIAQKAQIIKNREQ